MPLLVFLLNVLVRSDREIPQSTGADLLLVFLLFDTTVLIAHGDFEPLIRDVSVRQNMVAFFVTMLLSTLVVWTILVGKVEKRILQSFSFQSGTYNSGFPVFWWIGSWSLVVAVVLAHVWSFVHRGG